MPTNRERSILYNEIYPMNKAEQQNKTGEGNAPRVDQQTARHIGKQLLAVATTKEQKAIALFWTGVCMDDLQKHGLTMEEYLKFNEGNFKTSI